MQAEFEKQSRKDPESQLRRNKITARIVGTHLAQLSNGEHRVDCRLWETWKSVNKHQIRLLHKVLAALRAA